mgnify:CR=1 FL=1
MTRRELRAAMKAQRAAMKAQLREVKARTEAALASGLTDVKRSVDALVTNFHLPESSLLMLVAAFAGRKRMLDAVKQIKSSRMGMLKGNAALYELPWYVIIGAPGSGKTRPESADRRVASRSVDRGPVAVMRRLRPGCPAGQAHGAGR